MADAMLILLAGGLLLATLVPRPDEASPRWLGLVSVLAMMLAGAGAIAAALLPREAADVPAFYRRIQAGLVLTTLAVVFVHRVALRSRAERARRIAAFAAFTVAVLAGSNLLHEAMLARGTAIAVPPKALSIGLQTIACAGVAAVPSVAFALALFPLFGVTTPEASGRSFRRLRGALSGVLAARAVVSVGGVLLFSPVAATPGPAAHVHPGLAATRWLIGIVAPVVFSLVGHRLALQGKAFGATAALLLGGLCALNGETLALVLIRRTGLPF